MKGLMMKDIYCLKKSMWSFLAVTMGVIFVAVLFVLSAKFGNVASTVTQLEKNGEMSREDFFKIFEFAVWVVLFIPIAYVGNVLDCFKADHEAGLAKVMLTLPLKSGQMIGCRFAVCLLYGGIGLIGSVIASLFVAMATDAFSFKELISVEFSLGSMLLAYMGIVMMLTYLFGAEHRDVVQSAVMLGILAVCAFVVYSKCRGVLEENLRAHLLAWAEKIQQILRSDGIFFFFAGLLIMAVTCLASVMILDKRKEGAL